MVMPGQVLDSWTACLRSFSAVMRISAALRRSASDIIGGKPLSDQSHAAINTTVSSGHSPVDGWRPDIQTEGGQFSDDCTLIGCPSPNPFARQALVAAIVQSGAPLGARAQRSRTSTIRVPGK